MAGKVRVRGVCGGLIVLKSTSPVTALIGTWLVRVTTRNHFEASEY